MLCSMPAASASLPVSTKSMSTRPASCCALSLPASSGAVAFVNTNRETRSGCSFEFLDGGLADLEVAGHVDDIDGQGLFRLGWRLRRLGAERRHAPNAIRAAVASQYLKGDAMFVLLLWGRGRNAVPPCGAERRGGWRIRAGPAIGTGLRRASPDAARRRPSSAPAWRGAVRRPCCREPPAPSGW